MVSSFVISQYLRWRLCVNGAEAHVHTVAQRIWNVPAVGIINVQHENEQSGLYVLFGKLLYSKVTCCSF